MTKDELQAKRAVALSELKNIEVALCLDEHYIDIIEKENAELKERVDNLYNSDCWASDQLTKAKELLRRFIKWARTEHCEKFDVILEQAEQFIKEIEK